MCDSRKTVATVERPHWSRLYAVLPLAIVTLALVELSVRVPVLRVMFRCGIVCAAFGAMMGWVRANRVALDQLDWCACAANAVTVRVISSPPVHQPRAAEAMAVVVGDPRGTADETREGLMTAPR